MQPDHGSVWRYRSTVPPTLYDETLGRHPQYLPLFTQVRGKDKFFAVRRIKVSAVLLFGNPRALRGSLPEPEGSVFVTHGSRMRYERLRLATPAHFLLGYPFRGYRHIRK